MKRFELIILIGAITFSLVISWLIVFNSNFFNLSGFGDDTVFSEKGCDFSIIKTTNKFLVLEKSKNTYINVLANVIKYKKNNGNLYVIGENGYAVIYLNENFCKVFYGKKNDIYENRQEFEIPSLVYILKSFNEFSKPEINYFSKLEEDI